jgi:hypothetical protein
MGYCIIDWMGYCILASVWMSSEAVNSAGTTVEPVSAQGDFFRRLVLWCYSISHYGACLHGGLPLTASPSAFCLHIANHLIKPTFDVVAVGITVGYIRNNRRRRAVAFYSPPVF